MNYLDAIKKKAAPVEAKPVVAPAPQVYIPTDYENYIGNVRDSALVYYLPELQELCQDFVDETLALDPPLLDAHHTGHVDFVVEMMSYFEAHTTVEVTEADDESADSEAELDPTDIIYSGSTTDKF